MLRLPLGKLKIFSGSDLCKLLSMHDFVNVRQKGSHIRMITEINGKHAITIPAHDPIKIGTLNAIMIDIAQHLEISKDEIIKKL